ncbi:1718_t:CDS:2 [Cetraspora pellucida]|uniref:1718_t:CDS:1 n=1 Tax=Cetraspora pellucida TaxID=1433469 RepID=A0A9N9AXK9_9GLOM|nr:1718_t:CDS:2 [Cetraspora pellucida]
MSTFTVNTWSMFLLSDGSTDVDFRHSHSIKTDTIFTIPAIPAIPHNICNHIFNGNVGAPVHKKLQNGAKVLEFGCETAIWTTEVAAEFPDSEFYAVDYTISSDSSDNNNNNVTFIECDILKKKLPFPDNEFDYIFSRDKSVIFGKDYFHDVLSELLRVLKPEGWLEIGYSCAPGRNFSPALGRLLFGLFSWAKLHNIDTNLMTNFESHLKETGKVEIVDQQVTQITSRADYYFGEVARENALSYFNLTKDVMAPFMKMTFEEFDILLKDIENEMRQDDGVVLQQKRVFAKKKNEIMHTVEPYRLSLKRQQSNKENF